MTIRTAIAAILIMLPAIAYAQQAVASAYTAPQAEASKKAQAADTAAVKHGPILKLEVQAVNMGVFKEDESSERTVHFTNAGDAPLVIRQVFSDCGCTVPSYSKEPIAPGESGEIKVLFKGRGRAPGDFRKVLRIRSNALNGNEILMVEGRIARSYINKNK